MLWTKAAAYKTIKIQSLGTTFIFKVFLLCLEDEPAAKQFFFKLTESEQSFYIKWICEAKQEATKTKRIAESITRLLKKQKFYAKWLKE